MMAGSLQLRSYRIHRRNGMDMANAACHAGINALEARLIDAEDAKNPPGDDCFRLTPGMARCYVGGLADTPLGDAMIARLIEE